jgi:putative sigma-54 modulation protein
MKIDILASHLSLKPEHEQHIHRRTHSVLARLGEKISRIEVRLTDINGPRGGVDKRCRILVFFKQGEPLLVQTHGGHIDHLIDHAFQRTGHAVRKRLGFLTHTRRSVRKPHDFLIDNNHSQSQAA